MYFSLLVDTDYWSFASLRKLSILNLDKGTQGSQACLEKPVSYITFAERLEFSDFHSCLSLSDCHTYLSLLSAVNVLTELGFSDYCVFS